MLRKQIFKFIIFCDEKVEKLKEYKDSTVPSTCTLNLKEVPTDPQQRITYIIKNMNFVATYFGQGNAEIAFAMVEAARMKIKICDMTGYVIERLNRKMRSICRPS